MSFYLLFGEEKLLCRGYDKPNAVRMKSSVCLNAKCSLQIIAGSRASDIFSSSQKTILTRKMIKPSSFCGIRS